MADTPVKKGTRKRLSMEIDHRQHLSVDIIDIGSKFVEPDVVAMHTKTAKDDCLYDVKIHNKAELKLVLALGVGSSLNRATESHSRGEPNNNWNLASQTVQTWTAKSQYQKRWPHIHDGRRSVDIVGDTPERVHCAEAVKADLRKQEVMFPLLRSRLHIIT